MAEEKQIVVELPDGRRARFPAGTSPDVVKATVERLQSESTDPTPSAGPASGALDTPATPQGPKPGALARSFLGRAVRGAVINRIDPAAEYAARIGETVAPVALKGETARVQGMNAERRRLQDAARASVGDTGVDVAGMVGTAAVDVGAAHGLLRAMDKPHLARPTSMVDMAKSGAIAGGLAAAMSPVDFSEELSGPDLTWQKAKQLGIGTALGAVAAPVGGLTIDKLVSGAGKLGVGIGNKLRSMVAPPPDLRRARDPRELEAFLQQQATETGVDWARVPTHIKDSLRQAAIRATSVTGELPVAAVRNRLIAEAEGLPPLTLGQATRDPSQFSREANSPDELLRNRFADQSRAADARLRGLPDAAGPPRTPYESGSVVLDDITGQATARRRAIDALYTTAKDDAAGYHRITNTSEFVRNALADLKTKMQYGELPDAFKARLAELEAGAGRNGQMSIRDAVQLRENLNARISSSQGSPEGVALITVKKRLDELFDNAQFSNTEKGVAAIEKFREASRARRELGKWEEKSRAIADLASRDPKTATERIFEKYIRGGSIEDTTGLWSVLGGPARQAMKRQFMDDIVEQSFNRAQSVAGNYSSALKRLNNFPREKLDIMFSKDELRSLRNTLEYLRLIKEEPAGGFVNRSRTAVDLKDFLATTMGMPIIGPTISAPLKNAAEASAARKALAPGAMFVPPEADPFGAAAEALAARMSMAAPGATLGGLGAMRGTQDEPAPQR